MGTTKPLGLWWAGHVVIGHGLPGRAYADGEGPLCTMCDALTRAQVHEAAAAKFRARYRELRARREAKHQ